MPVKTYASFRILLMLCSFASYVFACLQYYFIVTGISKASFNASKSPGTLFKDLHCIWYARITRRVLSFLIRTPLRKRVLSLINFTIPIPCDSGCVIVICHSPWKRILVQWCLENKFALIVGGGKWSHPRKSIQRQAAGYTDLRNIIRYLQLKGRVILAADFFNGLSNCPVKFLGNNYNASIVHVRLAIMAKVPLQVIIPKLNSTSIDFIAGPAIAPDSVNADYSKTAKQILSFFEKEIEQEPSLWSSYVK